MDNAQYSQAIAEAYASAPTNVVVLDTLEIRNPGFIDDDGNPTAIRVTSNRKDVVGRLEASAPINAGEIVRFVSFGFTLQLPPEDTKLSPAITVTIDNADRLIVSNIQRAIKASDPIYITYRPYLSNDNTAPSIDPVLHLVFTDITADLHKVSGIARFGDLANKRFPSEVYTSGRFPLLAG